MRLQWRSGQQGKQGDTFVGFSRLVGVGHASFEVLKIGRERGAVCATSHTTDFPYSTSISASSIAAGVSGRIFLLPLQANLFCIGNPAEDGFSYFAARQITRPLPCNANHPPHVGAMCATVPTRLANLVMLNSRFSHSVRTRPIGLGCFSLSI